MRTSLQCAPCVIDDLRGALEDVAGRGGLAEDQALCYSILREAMEWLGQEFCAAAIPSYYITHVHRLLKQYTGLRMPFEELRARCNEVGSAVASRISRRLSEMEDERARLQFLCLWTIAGNHLDFRTVGTGYALSTEEIEAQLAEVVGEGLAIDHTYALAKVIGDGPKVLYLCDNVGEIALDRLLVEELQRQGCVVTAAVKGGPITSDAVLADAQRVGLAETVPVILTGPDTLGLPMPEEMSAQMEAALQSADLVVSKGQANYYALSEAVENDLYAGLPGHVFCLLRTKCQPVAADLGFPDRSRINVIVKLDKPSRKLDYSRMD